MLARLIYKCHLSSKFRFCMELVVPLKIQRELQFNNSACRSGLPIESWCSNQSPITRTVVPEVPHPALREPLGALVGLMVPAEPRPTRNLYAPLTPGNLRHHYWNWTLAGAPLCQVLFAPWLAPQHSVAEELSCPPLVSELRIPYSGGSNEPRHCAVPASKTVIRSFPEPQMPTHLVIMQVLVNGPYVSRL